MKIVFVDFDGVLNHVDPREPASTPAEGALLWEASDLDETAVKRLDALLSRTDARVVITSTWRGRYSLDELRGLLAQRGLTLADRVLDTTPHLWRDAEGRRLHRGDEIRAWLDAHPDVDAFAVLDDDETGMEAVAQQHVKTTLETGLLDGHVEAAVRLLNG